jgi:hypothetical protein
MRGQLAVGDGYTPRMPRWRAADVVVERFGASEVLVARTGGAPGFVLSLGDARVLVACDSFDDDDAHAARIAGDVELAEAEVVAGLGRLRDHGLLISDDEARATAIEVARHAEAPAGIAAVGILTCDRPRCVARLLDGLRRSTRLPLWICDDSRSDSYRAATRDIASAARREGADVRVLARDGKQRLAAALVAAGAARELVELALFDPEGLGYTTGANRNAFRPFVARTASAWSRATPRSATRARCSGRPRSCSSPRRRI